MNRFKIFNQLISIPVLFILCMSACIVSTPSSEQQGDDIPPTLTENPTSSSNDDQMDLMKNCKSTIPMEMPPETPYSTVVEAFDLRVSSGNQIYGLIRRPDPESYAELCFPAVILVPGGINPGRMLAHGQDSKALSEAGMVVITFNPEGRVDASPDDLRSEGTEDFNGYRHQDSLCDLVRYVIQLPFVISENVGIQSQSYGITMAAGCVGRHPDLPVKYLVDGEGPPNSFVTCHEPRALVNGLSDVKFRAVYEIFGRHSVYRDPSPANNAFWSEREADRFIGAFRGRYLRLQAEWDHAQPPASNAESSAFQIPPLWWHNKHTTDIVNSAIAGGVPWVRVNLEAQGNSINSTYDIDHSPTYLPGMLAEKPWAVWAILEMARME